MRPISVVFAGFVIIAVLLWTNGALAKPRTSISLTGYPSVKHSSEFQAVARKDFLGAFFRPIGAVPYGVFLVNRKMIAPTPYPPSGGHLFGVTGYCDSIAANGVSISSGYMVDPIKLSNIVQLGVRWTLTVVSSEFDDQTHIFRHGVFSFVDLDSAECAEIRHNIEPVIALEAGPVVYNLLPNGWMPKELPRYANAKDFGRFCGGVARHETESFPTVNRYSIPGNEVNSNSTMFPDGLGPIASYSKACYSAIKAVQPNARVYGLELSMRADLNAAAFVRRLSNVGCGLGTCYDALSIHLYLPWPIPASATPCFPNPGGNYGVQCIGDIQKAAHSPHMHMLIGETAFTIPGSVKDEATKAVAVIAAFKLFAENRDVDGVSYANVDECALYRDGFFKNGCLVDLNGKKLPAYYALQKLALSSF